ncbi:MAG: penicillin-binding protein, partial [Paraclostridium sp.]
YKYLLDHIGSYGVSKDEAVKLANKMKKEDDEKAKKEFEKEQKEKESKGLFGKDEKDKAEFVPDNSESTKARYLRKAIKELNPKIKDEDIDRFKQDYASFAWAAAFAPANDPEIAVVTVLPQGNSSSLALLPIREVMGEYFGLTKDKEKDKENKNQAEDSNKEAELVKSKEDNEMNFVSQLKK